MHCKSCAIEDRLKKKDPILFYDFVREYKDLIIECVDGCLEIDKKIMDIARRLYKNKVSGCTLLTLQAEALKRLVTYDPVKNRRYLNEARRRIIELMSCLICCYRFGLET